MASRVTMLLPDLDKQIGHVKPAVQQMMDIAAVLDQQGTLPSPAFVKVTPNITGHGEAWYHAEGGVFVIRADHRPVLLTSERCGTCTLAHMDTAHAYLFGSWSDFENRAYMRYVGAQIEAVGLASNEGGA